MEQYNNIKFVRVKFSKHDKRDALYINDRLEMWNEPGDERLGDSKLWREVLARMGIGFEHIKLDIHSSHTLWDVENGFPNEYRLVRACIS